MPPALEMPLLGLGKYLLAFSRCPLVDDATRRDMNAPLGRITFSEDLPATAMPPRISQDGCLDLHFFSPS